MNQSLDDLTRAVDRLTDEAVDLRSQLRSRTRALWSAWVAAGIILAVVIVAAFVVSLDNRKAIDANNRRWCPVVAPLVPRPGDPPPVGTPEQQQRALRIRDAFTDLAEAFGCPLP